jgi:SAM-dependent methyltransferase
VFKDHFSRQAEAYRRHRPGYPAELFAWLAELCEERRCAIDCATGNGQAAIGFAEHFAYVVANDGSYEQVRRAPRHPRIGYVVNLAERLAVAGGSVDCVGAAQAAHWFDFPPFYAEVRRVLKPAGVVALWTYEKFRVTPTIDALIDRFYTQVVGPYWPRERRYVEEAYRTLPFPFAEIAAPRFELETRWTLDATLGYLASWSAVQRFREARGEDPLPALGAELEPHWPSGDAELVLHWPIHVRVGRP